MVNHLYEALGVSKDATNEEIRKAYKKRALQTHPDRLPPNATPADKSNAEEQFRKINNAYEVLTDELKRKEYDRYGVWPIPESVPSASFSQDRPHHRHRPHHGHSSPFDDPFFQEPMFGSTDFFEGPFSRPRQRHQDFMFTDPFALFEAILGEHRRAFNDPFTDSFFSASPLMSDPFSRHHLLFGPSSLFDRTSTFPGFHTLEPPPPNNGHLRSHSTGYHAASNGIFGHGADGNGNWVSESRMTRTVNGVTQSVWKRRDAEGNEHVTYSYPDGREQYLLNGVEQPSNGRIAMDRSIPPPPDRSIQPPPVDRSIPPPPYPGNPARQHSPRKHEHRPYNENYARETDHVDGEAHSRRKWWRGQR